MSKLPYIPIYPGDWNRDTDCLSANAEFALFKLTIKLNDANTKGVYSAPIETLARLFKSTPDAAKATINELKITNTLIIEEQEFDIILFKSRRILRELEVSETRSKAGKKSAKKRKNTTPKTTDLPIEFNKTQTKGQQNPEIEIDNDVVIVNKTEEEISREKKFCNEILSFFGFNEINHPKNFMAMYQAYRIHDLKGSLEHFITQCRAYKKYIEQTGGGKYKFRFENFLGKQDEGFSGTWNSENWQNKLTEATAANTPGEKPVVFIDTWSKTFYQSIPIPKRKEYVQHLQNTIGGNIVTIGSGDLPRWQYGADTSIANATASANLLASMGAIGKEKQAS